MKLSITLDLKNKSIHINIISIFIFKTLSKKISFFPIFLFYYNLLFNILYSITIWYYFPDEVKFDLSS